MKNQPASDHPGAAGERFVFDSALIRADSDRLTIALRKEICVRSVRRETRMMTEGGAKGADVDHLEVVHKEHGVRNAEATEPVTRLQSAGAAADDDDVVVPRRERPSYVRHSPAL